MGCAADGERGLEARQRPKPLAEGRDDDLSTGAKSWCPSRPPGRMTPDELARAREGMRRLKLHACDVLPNAAAIERAEALYVDLRRT